MKALRYGIPLVLFAALVAFFAVGLTRDPREVPSPFIGKPAPQFKLTELGENADRAGPLGQQAHEPPAARVGQGGEECIHGGEYS